MSNRRKSTCEKNLIKSPWLNRRLKSDLNTGFELCEYAKTEPSLEPNDAINWVYQMGNETMLRVALARYAPLIRLDDPFAETWISPPASWAGDTTVIVCGFDATGKLRTAGGNWCSPPRKPDSAEPSSYQFFEQFDRCTRDPEKIDLLQETLNICAASKSTRCADEVYEMCRVFRARPIHVIVLTDNGLLWATLPGVIHGRHFRNPSLEKVGSL